jgi:hypothetical protein
MCSLSTGGAAPSAGGATTGGRPRVATASPSATGMSTGSAESPRHWRRQDGNSHRRRPRQWRSRLGGERRGAQCVRRRRRAAVALGHAGDGDSGVLRRCADADGVRGGDRLRPCHQYAAGLHRHHLRVRSGDRHGRDGRPARERRQCALADGSQDVLQRRGDGRQRRRLRRRARRHCPCVQHCHRGGALAISGRRRDQRGAGGRGRHALRSRGRRTDRRSGATPTTELLAFRLDGAVVGARRSRHRLRLEPGSVVLVRTSHHDARLPHGRYSA